MSPVRKQFSNGVKIVILGYGIEGKSAERFLRSSLRRRTSKCEIEIRDIKKQGNDYLKNLGDFDMIVRSPGVRYLLPEIQKAKKRGVAITSATKLFFHNAKGTLVGITGTKGKGTVATLLYKILKTAGKDVYLVGNIGKPALDILPELSKNSVTIYELSSFQLQDLDRSPEIAVVTDISPDHLDYHKSFYEYINAKTNIVRFQKKNCKVFYFPDNKYSKLIAQKSRGKKVSVVANPNLKLKILGFHNLKNASMAASVGRALGAPEKIIKQTIKNFKGLPYRLEFIRETGGVKFYNDSASTNPAATTAALAAFNEPKILIAGGAEKNLSYKPLAKAIKKSKMRAVILFGRDKYKIKRSIEVPTITKLVGNLKSAVVLAKKRARGGDIVIFSPGAASFDMFKNSKDRGERFTNLVKSLN